MDIKKRCSCLLSEIEVKLNYLFQIEENRAKRTVHRNSKGLVTSIDGLSGQDEAYAINALNAEILGEETLSDSNPY